MSGKETQSWWSQGWKRFKKNRVALYSAYLVFIVCLIALVAKWITPYPFDEQNVNRLLENPSWQHWMGTDKLGRDLFSRLIYGSRMSMAIGVVTAVISLLFGTLFGAISGWFGGFVDSFMMRTVDIFYSIPSIVLMILVKVVFDSVGAFENPELRALAGTLFALSIVGWVTLARLVRGQVLQVKAMSYVESGYALGLGPLRILWRHVLPNILGPIIVMLTFRIPGNILFESFLSFIGLGLQPPYSSWGVLASDGADMLESYPHLILFPGAVLFITMMAFQLLGDGLRDAFDPQLEVQKERN